MALSTRRLCVLLLVLLAVAATFCHGHGAVLQDNDRETAATFPGRRAGPPVAGAAGGGAYHGSGSSHVPRSYLGSNKASFSVNIGDYSAGDRRRIWNVGEVAVAPVLAAAWFA